MAINYPYRVFRFKVQIDGITRASFAEVSGMSATIDAVEYREGDDLRNTPRKMPGLAKFGNVTLRWGVADDTDFVEWLKSVAPTNSTPPTGMTRKNVTVTLIDDAGADGPQWLLLNAWPVSYTAPDLNGMGAEVAIHALELCCEGLEHTPGKLAGTASTV